MKKILFLLCIFLILPFVSSYSQQLYSEECSYETPYKIYPISGKSMQPLIYAGDEVVDVPVSLSNLEVGSIIIFQIPKKRLIHRIISITSDGRYITKGDNNLIWDFRFFPFIPLKTNFSQVYGKVVCIRGFKYR